MLNMFQMVKNASHALFNPWGKVQRAVGLYNPA